MMMKSNSYALLASAALLVYAIPAAAAAAQSTTATTSSSLPEPTCLSETSWEGICLTLEGDSGTCGPQNGTSAWYDCVCNHDGNANTGHCARNQGNMSPSDALGANYLYRQACGCLCDPSKNSTLDLPVNCTASSTTL